MPHRHQHAGDPDAAAHRLHGADLRRQLVDAGDGKGVNLGRDDDVVADGDARDRHRRKARRAVNEDVVVVGLRELRRHKVPKAGDQRLIRGRRRDIELQQVHAGGDDVHAVDLRHPAALVPRALARENVVQRHRRVVAAEKAGRVCLRVCVDQQHALAVLRRQDAGHVDGRGGFADTALEINNANNFHFLHLLLFFFLGLPGSLGCRSLRGSVSSPARSGK